MSKKVTIGLALATVSVAVILLWVDSPVRISDDSLSLSPIDRQIQVAPLLEMGNAGRAQLWTESDLDPPSQPNGFVTILSSVGLPIDTIQVKTPRGTWSDIALHGGRVLRRELNGGIEVGAPGHQAVYWVDGPRPIVLRPAGGLTVTGLDPGLGDPIADFSTIGNGKEDHPLPTDLSVSGWTGEHEWTIAVSPVRCEHGWNEHTFYAAGNTVFVEIALPFQGMIRAELRLGSDDLGLIQLQGLKRADALPLAVHFSGNWQLADLEMEVIPVGLSVDQLKWRGQWGNASYSSNWARRLSLRSHRGEFKAPRLPLGMSFLLRALNLKDATWCSTAFVHTGQAVLLSPSPGIQLLGELRCAIPGETLPQEVLVLWEGMLNGKPVAAWIRDQRLDLGENGSFQISVPPSSWRRVPFPEVVRITVSSSGFMDASVTAPVGVDGLVDIGVLEVSPLRSDLNLLPGPGIDPKQFELNWVFGTGNSGGLYYNAPVQGAWESDDGIVHLSLALDSDCDSSSWKNLLLGTADGTPLPITRFDDQSFHAVPRERCQIVFLPFQMENARVDMDLEWRGIRVPYRWGVPSEEFREAGSIQMLLPEDGFGLFWSLERGDLIGIEGSVHLLPGSASVPFKF